MGGILWGGGCRGVGDPELPHWLGYISKGVEVEKARVEFVCGHFQARLQLDGRVDHLEGALTSWRTR